MLIQISDLAYRQQPNILGEVSYPSEGLKSDGDGGIVSHSLYLSISNRLFLPAAI
jgi:hypothetical protein